MRLAAPARRALVPSLLPLLALAGAYWFVVVSLAGQWADDPNYAHGFFVPAMAAVLAWQRRGTWTAAPSRVDAWGLSVVAAGVILYGVGILCAELFTTRVSLVVVLAGLVIALQGSRRFRVLALPLLFLLCMIPLPYVFYYRLTFPLQLESSRLAASILTGAGMPLVREGNILRLEGYTLEVVAACSGLRSIMTLGTLGLFLAGWMRLGPARGAALLVLVVPVAIGANVARLCLTAGIAAIGGPRVAESFLHELSGLVVFVTGLLALFAFARGMQWIGRARS